MASIGTNNNGRATASPPFHHATSLVVAKPTAQEEGLFTIFPNLPPELRERIWDSYENESHVINIYEYGLPGRKMTLKFRYKGLPAFAGVNIESRRVFLRRYKPLAKDTGIFIDLSTDIFNFYTEDTYRSFIGFGLASRSDSEGDSFQGNLLILEDVETKLSHVALSWHGLKEEQWCDLVRLAGLKTLTLSFYTADGLRDQEMLGWEKDFESAWTNAYGQKRKCPQLLWETRVYIGSLTGDQRSWLNQSTEGIWSWKHGTHSSKAQIKGWVPRKENLHGMEDYFDDGDSDSNDEEDDNENNNNDERTEDEIGDREHSGGISENANGNED